VPWLLGGSLMEGHTPKKNESTANNLKALNFLDVVVNLDAGPRQSRYLKVKLLVAVAEADANEVNQLLEKQKPFLKSWLIGYLSDLPPREVNGKMSVNRIRREIRDHFNAVLYPNGDEKIADVLVDEFLVQYQS
jgi:flagellar basal body-associated protein FliL